MSIRSVRDLTKELSSLNPFVKANAKLEQYSTPAHIAAQWVWDMTNKSEVVGKSILDAGCGTGILGIGLLLMGAKEMYFIDTDLAALEVAQQNYTLIQKEYEVGEAHFIHQDISLFDQQVDIVIQNPPFGTKQEHADKVFLEKAFEVSSIVYSMHKFSTKKFIESIAKDNGYIITDVWRFDFTIKASMKFHTKPVRSVDVGLWRMQK